MNKLFTLSVVLFFSSLGLSQFAHAQEVIFPEIKCPPNSEYCFAGDGFDLGPADQFFGSDFELAARFSAKGSFSRVMFWGFFAEFPTDAGKDLIPATADFEVKIYENGPSGPGALKASYIFANQPMGLILRALKIDHDPIDLNDYLRALEILTQ